MLLVGECQEVLPWSGKESIGLLAECPGCVDYSGFSSRLPPVFFCRNAATALRMVRRDRSQIRIAPRTRAPRDERFWGVPGCQGGMNQLWGALGSRRSASPSDLAAAH